MVAASVVERASASVFWKRIATDDMVKSAGFVGLSTQFQPILEHGSTQRKSTWIGPQTTMRTGA